MLDVWKLSLEASWTAGSVQSFEVVRIVLVTHGLVVDPSNPMGDRLRSLKAPEIEVSTPPTPSP
eukprot:4023593-Prymnesium_polylepis.2